MDLDALCASGTGTLVFFGAWLYLILRWVFGWNFFGES